MTYFEPAPDRPISSEMIRQGFSPSADEALEICHLDEAASGTDTTIALATAAIAVACSAGILGLSGLTLPILLPLGSLGLGAVTAWNSRLTQRQRESEAEFLEEHGGILDLAEQKLNQGQPAHKVAAAIESALRAYNYGEAPTLSLGPASSPATAQPPKVGTQTQLGAISIASSPVEVLQDDSRPEAIAPQDGPLSVLLATPYQNRLVFGGQRTGKSFLVAIATRYLASKGIKVYHLNLSHTKTSEGRDEDAEYWQHATASIRCDLGSLSTETASSVIDKAINMVQNFWAQTGAILVVDEGPAQAATSNMHRVLLDPLNALIAAMSSQCNSTGLKRAKSVWAIGPEFVAANMTQHGKSFCKMGSLVHVFIHPASQSEWNGQRLVFDTGLFKQLSTNFQGTILETASAEFCDRAAQIEGSFYSLDGLTLPDWDGKKCVAAAIPHEVKHSSPPPPDHQGQAEKPKPVSENSAATLEQQIADFIKAYPPGSGGLKLREIKRKFRNEDPKKVEGICLTLARCFPDKFRISEDTVGGNKTIKVEAIT
jgi:hypothetical protein